MKIAYVSIAFLALMTKVFCNEPCDECCNEKEKYKPVPLNFLDQIFFKVPGCLIISQGQVNEYRIQGEEAALKEIKVQVNSGDLTIEPKGMQIGPKKLKPIKVYVTARNLEEVNLFGDSSCNLKGINVQKLILNIKGSSTVRGDLTAQELVVNSKGSSNLALKGTVAKESLDIEGSSEVDFSKLSANSVNLVSKGSSNIQIKVSKKLSVVIEGSGSVVYFGSPKIDSNTKGQGVLRKGLS